MNLSKRDERIAILLILVLAAALRILPLGVSSYAWDEARISFDALRIARGGIFLFMGQQSSVGIPFFPASVWAFVPPFQLSADPLVAVVYVALLNTLMVLGVWWLGRRWTHTAGLIGALFLAANPFAVFYARSIWQPNLLGPLMLAWLIAAFQGSQPTQTRARSIGIAFAVLIGGLGMQIHFAGAAMIPLTLYALIRFKWWKTPIPVLIGAAIALLAALPYFYALLTTPDVISQAGTVASGGLTIDFSAALSALRLALGHDWAYLGSGIDSRLNNDDFVLFMEQMTLIFAAALLLIGAWVVIKRARRGDRLSELTLAALVTSPLTFLIHTSPVLPHYELVTLPAFGLIAGAGIGLFGWRLWKIAVPGIVLVLAAMWTVQAALTLDQANRVRPLNSALSSILRESRDAAAAAREDALGAPILFYTHGDDPVDPQDGEATVFTTLLWEDRGARVLNGDVLLILPDSPSLQFSTLAPIQAWEELEASGLTSEAHSYPRRLGAEPFVSTYVDNRAVPDASSLGMTALETPIALDDHTQLEGWRVRWVGSRWRVSTLWRVTDTLPHEAIQQFHHLYRAGDDVNAAPFMGSDTPLSVHTWRLGDQVIVMADFFEVPPGAGYTLAVGHYRLGDGGRIARADGQGDRILIEGVTVEAPQ
ncbi:MAG: hypothetical protein U0670_08835 [Anaerolineae bacterium]